jgi:hypothetical protein
MYLRGRAGWFGRSQGITSRPIPVHVPGGVVEYRPYFEPDEGVTDVLLASDVPLTKLSDGTFVTLSDANLDRTTRPTRSSGATASIRSTSATA